MSYKYCVFLHTGYTGMDSHEFLEFDEKPLEEELGDICWDLAVQHAESYGIYPECDRCLYAEEDEIDDESFSDNIEGYAEEYDPEKHDGYAIGIPHFCKY